MSFYDDDVFMGESLRGMQDDMDVHLGNVEIGAAQRQLAALRRPGAPGGQLGQLAQRQALQNFARYAPYQQRMRPAYKDSTQIGIKCTGTFTPANWSGSTSLPEVTGRTRVYESFKPTKAILVELVTITFTNDSDVATSRSASVSDAGDLVLTSAFSGAKNCFPTAPDEETGIPGPAFARDSLGNGISWPTINGGIDMVVRFSVEDTILTRVDPPTGYTYDDITSVVVKVRFALLGPSLRP